MTPENMALRLRAALAQLQELTSNDSFYNDERKESFSFKATLAALDAHYPVPEFSLDELALLDALRTNGIANAETFVKLRRDPNADYTQIENGSTLMDHEVTFDKGVAYGVKLMREQNGEAQ